MKRTIFRSVAAVLFVALVWAAASSSCVLKIGKGAGPEPQETGGTAEGGGGAGTGGENSAGTAGSGGGAIANGNDIEEANALFAAHPEEVALGNLKASYVALALSNLVFDGTTDPNDDAAIAALVEQYTPTAVEEAEGWIASLDASTLQQVINLAYSYPLECIYEPYLCSPKLVNCPWLGEDHVCYLSECGIGKCSYCPFPFPLPVRSWCIHNCFRMGDGSFVGSALYITLVGGTRLGPICVPK